MKEFDEQDLLRRDEIIRRLEVIKAENRELRKYHDCVMAEARRVMDRINDLIDESQALAKERKLYTRKPKKVQTDTLVWSMFQKQTTELTYDEKAEYNRYIRNEFLARKRKGL